MNPWMTAGWVMKSWFMVMIDGRIGTKGGSCVHGGRQQMRQLCGIAVAGAISNSSGGEVFDVAVFEGVL